MELDDLRRNWEDLGLVDPMWAILADPSRHGNRWSADEFFETGDREVQGYLTLVDRLGLKPGGSLALDFGCGAGRLTQPLARRFDAVVGVDIAESMTRLAARENARRNPQGARVSFVTNTTKDLYRFEDQSVDYVLSVVVLQHMNNDLKAGYIREFVRLLSPGGVAMFTVPSHADWSVRGMVRRLPNPVQNLYRRRRYGYRSVMEFHAMHRNHVEATIAEAGATLVEVRAEPMAGPPWTSYLYVVTRSVA